MGWVWEGCGDLGWEGTDGRLPRQRAARTLPGAAVNSACDCASRASHSSRTIRRRCVFCVFFRGHPADVFDPLAT